MEPEHFEALYPEITRFEEIKKILQFVKEGNSCQLIGVPGAGRSNLLGLLSYNRNVRIKHLRDNQKWFHFVLLNFSEIRNKPLFEVTKFMFLGLLDSLRERKMDSEYETVNKIFKESMKINDELVLFQGLKKTIDFLAIEKELTVVFLFDRFEEYVPMLTPDFFTNLRVLRNRAKYRFSVVFATSRPVEDILEPTFFADFYEFMAGKIVYMSIYDKPGLDFRISYLEKITGKKIDKKTLEAVMKLTAGHGSLVRHCLEATLASSNEPSATSFELTEFFLKQKPVRSALSGIWNCLTPSEQNLLASSIQLLASSDKNESLLYLENVGLIKNNKLTIPLLKEYVKDSSRIHSENTGQIVYDENTNEIKKGDLVISDKLTSSEFKLLQFLILNSDKVLSREEIIKAVWKDTQTTAGVTDQALDQLIFRLRKKIENDPNKPTHIQTVKGRGVKFSN